ncbi:RAD24 Checkpoint protein RAD24 [Candida maltosa Xu316]
MPPRKRQKRQIVEEIIESDEIQSESDTSLTHDHWSVPPSPTKHNNKNTSEQWIDKYKPRHVSDICINPTKLAQVRETLSSMIKHTSNSPRILILAGPSGSSKSTTVKLLARQLIPTANNTDLLMDNADDVIVEYHDTGTGSDDFGQFIRDVKYKRNSIILIEELPNIYHTDTLLKFRSTLRDWCFMDFNNGELPPLVICLSELEYDSEEFRVSYNIENNLTVETLLGKEMLSMKSNNGGSLIQVIKFNKLANRFLKKTVNGIIKNEGLLKKVNHMQLNEFQNEIFKVGDIRSIICNLEMWVKNVRKIIYSTTTVHGDNEDYVDMKSIDQVLSSFPEKNMDLLNLGLLENYQIFQDSKLEPISNLVDDLSINDLIKLGNVGIRSTRLNLRKSSGGSSHKLKMKFPRHFKMNRMARRTSNQINSYRQHLDPSNSFDNLNLIDGYFLPLIYNHTKKTKFRYNRLGGKFQEVYADEDIPVEDNENGGLYEYDQFEIDIQNKINQDLSTDGIDDDGELSDPIETDSDNDSEIFSSDSELDLLLTQGKY